ncbi:surface-adhesin E family protein [Chitinimonas lacunae]|uniref:Surface-adhesin E family protein n=1 Tax=Chitinimonas lacunae TaxID=1963018 RepID=A0ABV8MQZ0_9NEIS
MKWLLPLALCLALSACKKFDANASDPEPVPDKPDWRLFGQMPDYDVKVDWNSIGHEDVSGDDSYVYVWVLREFKKDQENKEGDTYRKEYSRFAVDCAKSSAAGIAIELHDHEDDEVMRRDVPGYQWEFQPATAQQNYLQNFVYQVCKIARDKEAAAR